MLFNKSDCNDEKCYSEYNNHFNLLKYIKSSNKGYKY